MPFFRSTWVYSETWTEVPTNLVATAGNAQVTLTWKSSAGATTYNVYRATAASGPYVAQARLITSPWADFLATERPAIAELVDLSQRASIPTFEDLGSGCLIDLAPYGVKDEPVVAESLKAGISVVSFSGEKRIGTAADAATACPRRTRRCGSGA